MCIIGKFITQVSQLPLSTRLQLLIDRRRFDWKSWSAAAAVISAGIVVVRQLPRRCHWKLHRLWFGGGPVNFCHGKSGSTTSSWSSNSRTHAILTGTHWAAAPRRLTKLMTLWKNRQKTNETTEERLASFSIPGRRGRPSPARVYPNVPFFLKKKALKLFLFLHSCLMQNNRTIEKRKNLLWIKIKIKSQLKCHLM